MDPQSARDVDLGTAEEPRMVRLGGVTDERRNRFVPPFRRYGDVFAWHCDELGTHDSEWSIGSPDVKPFRRKQRPVDPRPEPIIRKRVGKLLKGKIIVLIRYGRLIWFRLEGETVKSGKG